MNDSTKHKRPIEIKDRHSGRVLFETEVETLKDALEEAVALRVNLSCADLRNLDLRGAYLANAELSNADFSGADLSNAILWKATLIGTRFCNVNLRHTNFRHAKLKKAVLKNSNLIGINFLGSDLIQADFRNSNLEGSELRDANLTHTYFDARLKAPEKGSFVGWKRIYDIQGNSVIAKLLIPEDAKRTTPLGGRYCRAEFVKVLELNPTVLFAKSKLYPTSMYYVGGIVRATYYESDVRAGYAHGIGFYPHARGG